MKVTYAPRPNLSIEFEANGDSELVRQIAKIQELMLQTCGKCESSKVVWQYRTVGKYTYHELKCRECHSVLSFGNNEDGSGLYPRRYEMDDKEPKIVDGKKVWLANNGWLKWNPETQQRE